MLQASFGWTVNDVLVIIGARWGHGVLVRALGNVSKDSERVCVCRSAKWNGGASNWPKLKAIRIT